MSEDPKKVNPIISALEKFVGYVRILEREIRANIAKGTSYPTEASPKAFTRFKLSLRGVRPKQVDHKLWHIAVVSAAERSEVAGCSVDQQGYSAAGMLANTVWGQEGKTKLSSVQAKALAVAFK